MGIGVVGDQEHSGGRGAEAPRQERVTPTCVSRVPLVASVGQREAQASGERGRE